MGNKRVGKIRSGFKESFGAILLHSPTKASSNFLHLHPPAPTNPDQTKEVIQYDFTITNLCKLCGLIREKNTQETYKASDSTFLKSSEIPNSMFYDSNIYTFLLYNIRLFYMTSICHSNETYNNKRFVFRRRFSSI